MGDLPSLCARLIAGDRLSLPEWMPVVEQAPSELLFAAANRIRRQKHPRPMVSYVVDRNINYTNLCLSGCAFCAFYRSPGSPQGYLLSHEAIYRKTEEALRLRADGILLQGGLNPQIPPAYFEDLLYGLKRRFSIYLHCFSPPEILFYARLYGLSVAQLLTCWKEAGLDSIPGGGAEILAEDLRSQISHKGSAAEWLETTRAAHRLGIPTTATMVLGLGENTTQRLQHLQSLRALQEETQGMVAFIPWTFQPGNTALYDRITHTLPEEEYLRWLAISRIYLDNIPHIQVSRLTQGTSTARRGLHCGADDLGSVMIEENVVAAAGAGHRADEQALREAIRGEGFLPRRRNAVYRYSEEDP